MLKGDTYQPLAPTTRVSFMSSITDILKESLADKHNLDIEYSYDVGMMKVNGHDHEVGKLSFSEVGREVLGTLREMYGEYRTIPYTFNSEAYENSRFKAEVLALGSIGLLKFRIEKKTYPV
jgi:hypothetical protein